MGPAKSRLTIIGIPVRSHEIVPGISGNGMSKGGPFISSDDAASAPSILVNESALVSNCCKCVSPLETKMVYAKSLFIFCKIVCLFCQLMLVCSEHVLDSFGTLFRYVRIFQAYHS